MNSHLWLEFFLSVFNPVYYEGQRYVDLGLVSKMKYPALKKLASHSTLEILLLAKFILLSENEDFDDRSVNEAYFHELFENYDCTNEEIDDALKSLYGYGWIEIVFDSDLTQLYFMADIPYLTEKRLYTTNKWKRLSNLGLNGNKISHN